MRPIPPRTPSGDQSSQDAIDAIVAGSPTPMGIPALLIADQLSRGRSADQVLCGSRGLLAEYAGAQGYAYHWGQLIEIRLGRYILWRVIPVAMWDHLVERRAGVAVAHRGAVDAGAARHSPRAASPPSARRTVDRLPRREPTQPARVVWAAARRPNRRYRSSAVARDAVSARAPAAPAK